MILDMQDIHNLQWAKRFQTGSAKDYGTLDFLVSLDLSKIKKYQAFLILSRMVFIRVVPSISRFIVI